jgi:F0F1-type ATP synthase delta subunit
MTKAVLKIAGSFRSEDIVRITRGFERLLKKEIEFDVVEDGSLIGGFTAFIDGRVYDSSILLQLERIRQGFRE